MNPQSIVNGYREAGYKVTNLSTSNLTARKALPWIVGEMKNNNVIQMNSEIFGQKIHHAQLITKVKYLADFSKFKISTMNPSGASAPYKKFL